jgi:hypothetical protein
MLYPEGAALGLYLSPGNSAVTGASSASSTPFADRRQVVDRFYIHGSKTVKSPSGGSEDIYEIDEPRTLVYIRNGVGAKVINRSQDPSVASTSTSSSSGTQPSSTADYGLAGSAYFGLGADGGLFALNKTTAGAFRIEGLLTATWADKNSVLMLYPNATKPQDVFYGAYARFSLSLNSNIKLSVQYAVPFGNSKAYAGKALLFGATVSQ